MGGPPAKAGTPAVNFQGRQLREAGISPCPLTHHPWVGPAACQAGPPGWTLALDLEVSVVGHSGITH